MNIKIINVKQIATFVSLCAVVLTSVTLLARCMRSGRGEDGNVPPALRRYLRFAAPAPAAPRGREPAPAPDPARLSALYDRLERRTADQASVRNWDRFGPVEADTPTLVVLAHHDAERLQYLIVSLARVRDVRSVLLVFSHAYYDERIEALVRTIDFCRVKQVYYPHSVQLFPTSFPGTDVDDCSDAGVAADGSAGCVQRDGRRAEGKHHWWWTAHTVFGRQWAWFAAHRGPVLFLREDSYVLPDLLHMLALAQRAAAQVPDVDLISFGGPLFAKTPEHYYDKFSIVVWQPLYENGLAFNRSTWAKISALSGKFCEYDDTSWGYSLLAVFGEWGRGRALAAAAWAPRVVSTGAAGAGGGRGALAALAPQLRAAAAAGALFPRRARAVLLYDRAGAVRPERPPPPPRGNGGWADYRDRNLCLGPLLTTDTEDDSTTTSPYFDTIKTNSRPK